MRKTAICISVNITRSLLTFFALSAKLVSEKRMHNASKNAKEAKSRKWKLVFAKLTCLTVLLLLGGFMTFKACSFTGHRRIKEGHVEKLIELLARAVNYAYSEGIRTFYAGGAYGFDMLAAREVLRFRAMHPDVRLVLLLPCPEQADAWSDRLRSNYEYVLREANEVEYISLQYTDDCMKKRNAELAARADMLIAYVYNMKSGSGQTVNFAKKAQKTVYNLYHAVVSEAALKK